MKFRCAGIVLYNPDMDKLRENISVIIKQVDTIILIDNYSNNSIDTLNEYSQSENIVIVRNDANMGVATAFNQICSIALELGYDFVLLLDQDSICSLSIMNSYEKYLIDGSVALLTPYIVDINKITLQEYYSFVLPEISQVDWAISSGSLIRLSTWLEVGKFDEDLFIDAVDFDYSARLKINNYLQLRVNSEFILHEVGNAEATPILRFHKDNSGKWSIKRYYRTNHSCLRHYYMTRNHIIVARKYSEYKPVWKGISFIILMSLPKLIVEKQRIKLLITLWRGLYDGFRFQITRYRKYS
ncbi:glycosyltransferase family 2 protein [Paenibacillus sp. FSL R10-2771]|uniref:glycosyltransferase family 2 protein n=1 Tax=Paenibacillus sp. FSL R10-2771 TaxID=2954693 RepID=UPI0030F6E5DD